MPSTASWRTEDEFLRVGAQRTLQFRLKPSLRIGRGSTAIWARNADLARCSIQGDKVYSSGNPLRLYFLIQPITRAPNLQVLPHLPPSLPCPSPLPYHPIISPSAFLPVCIFSTLPLPSRCNRCHRLGDHLPHCITSGAPRWDPHSDRCVQLPPSPEARINACLPRLLSPVQTLARLSHGM